jgi:ketosteroid isomerase-like protein
LNTGEIMKFAVRLPFAAVALSIFSCAAFVVGCHSSAPQQASSANSITADEATIRRLDEDWVTAAGTKQPDAWMAFYADDAVVLPPNEKVAANKETIRKSVAGLLGLPGLELNWSATKLEVAASGDLAYMYGPYTLKMNDAKGKIVMDYGKVVEVWKKQANGRWKCVVDTWNSDLPEAPES